MVFFLGFFFEFFWFFGFFWLKSDTTKPERAQRADQHVYASARKQGNLLTGELTKKQKNKKKVEKIEKYQKKFKKIGKIIDEKKILINL